jgi:hypothetical protein
MHIFGDILTKISVNCVLNFMLHYYLCVYFYGFILCVVYNCQYIYEYCLSMLLVYVTIISSMNFCIYRTYLSIFSYIYKVSTEVFCVYVLNLHTIQNILRSIAQLDVGDVRRYKRRGTRRSSSRRRRETKSRARRR